MWTLLMEVVIFVITIILAMIDSTTWPGVFFYLTIITVIILNSKYSQGHDSPVFKNYS
jgi:equilibrative nucleoside transporter 1/2/3